DPVQLHHGMTVFFTFRHSDEAPGQNLGLIGERVHGLGRLTEDGSSQRTAVLKCKITHWCTTG
ncbi:hypothetical protein, partial [Mesotoga prima]|uniref:hypothetical protein n=1 Tax=Mesotoga prima TaxID=1184387 RepID=UPI002FDA1B23